MSPRARTPSATALARGWEETKDSYGRTYFLHRESGHSCWARPLEVQLAWRYRSVTSVLNHLLSRGVEHDSVRVTLEADEDRVKLFTALYHLVLEDVTRERCGGPAERDAESVPTLAVCHKRARAMKIKVKDYAAFLERVVRGLPVRLREIADATEEATGQRPKTPGSCRSCKSGRHFHFEPAEESTSPTHGSLSLAEYGSLQAQRFRERRAQEIELAQDRKRESETHFGSPRHDGSRTPKMPLPSIKLVKKDEEARQQKSSPPLLRVITDEGADDEARTPPEDDDYADSGQSGLHLEEEMDGHNEVAQDASQVNDHERHRRLRRPRQRHDDSHHEEDHEDTRWAAPVSHVAASSENADGAVKRRAAHIAEERDEAERDDALRLALEENERYRAQVKLAHAGRDEAGDELEKVREELTEQLERERIERAALTRELHDQRQQFQKMLQDQRGGMQPRLSSSSPPASPRTGLKDRESKGEAGGGGGGLRIDFGKSELVDAKLTISRLSQQCKKLENELARARVQARDPAALAGASSSDHVQEALLRFKHAEERLIESEEEVAALSLQTDELQRQVREAEAGRSKACQEALELRLDRDQQIAALKQQYSDEVAEIKRAQALELATALCSAKEHYRANLEEQREKFFNQSRMLEEQLQSRLRAQSESHVTALAQLKDAHDSSLVEAEERGRRAERERSVEAMADADAIHQSWVLETRRRGAVGFLNSVYGKARFAAMSHAFANWTRALDRERADELVEVYSAAIDQTAAGARIAFVWSKVLQRATTAAFGKWRSRVAQGLGVDPVRPELYQKEPLYPGELRRKLRRRLKQQRMFGDIDRLCDGLEVNTNGKVEPRTFHRALLQRECAWHKLGREFDGALMAAFLPEHRRIEPAGVRARDAAPVGRPSEDWRLAAGVAIQRLDALVQQRDLLFKCKAWGQLKLNLRDRPGGLGAPRFGDFMRNMETEALQEEVRALHVQLGASKAEAWKYKRKLLANYLG